MEDKEWLEAIQQLEKKLARAQKRGAVLYQKAKLLEEIVDITRRYEEDARTREHDASALIRQLITRQRELNVMLNRSNTLVARMYEANQTMSLEVQEAAKALPAPQRAEIEQKVTQSKAVIEDLFKKTGIPDAETSGTPSFANSDSFTINTDHPRRDGLWSRKGDEKPPMVAAEPVEEHTESEFIVNAGVVEDTPGPVESTVDAVVVDDDEEDAVLPEISDDRRRKWWARFGFGQSSD